MRISLPAPRKPRTPGTRWAALVLLRFRSSGAPVLTTVTPRELRQTVLRWTARVAPDDRKELTVRAYARVYAKSGGLRRLLLAEWRPTQPLEPFLKAVRARIARLPTDDRQDKYTPGVSAYVDDEQFGRLMTKARGRLTKR
jgi:hypothetical protein